MSPASRLSIVALFTVALGLPLAHAQSESDYEKQLQELSSTVNKLKKELVKTKSSRDKLAQSLQSSEEEISSLQKKIDSIKEALSREKKQLALHQGRRTELEASREQQQHQINNIIRQAYLLGQQSQIKLLLNQEEPYRVSRMLRYHDYVVSARKEKMDKYLSTIREINETQQAILATTERMEANQQSLNARYLALKDKQAERVATLAKLTKELSTKGSDLAQAEKDQLRLERLLEEATQTLSELKLPSDTRPFTSVKGKLPYPASGRIRHAFGSPRVGNKLYWKGVFIDGRTGSDVVSVHYGRVIFSDYLRGHGLLLIVDHGDGYMSLYAHNQILLKETGDWVRSGERIATVGDTGGLNRAGLYFEIRHKGRPVDPKPWLGRNRG